MKPIPAIAATAILCLGLLATSSPAGGPPAGVGRAGAVPGAAMPTIALPPQASATALQRSGAGISRANAAIARSATGMSRAATGMQRSGGHAAAGLATATARPAPQGTPAGRETVHEVSDDRGGADGMAVASAHAGSRLPAAASTPKRWTDRFQFALPWTTRK